MNYQDSVTLREVEIRANRSRIASVLTAYKCGDGHLSSSLSYLEIICVILNLNHDSKFSGFKFVLSKGHGVLGYYAALSEFGYLDHKELLTFNKESSRLSNHPNSHNFDLMELSSGSLGMGLGYGVGLALGNKLKQNPEKVIVLVGDGECNEGSIWEAALFASTNKLNNVIAIIDHNKIQAVASYMEINSNLSLAERFKAFGWKVLEIDGHDVNQIQNSITAELDCPTAIIAHTSGEKSFPYEANSVLWHYRRPSKEDLQLFEKHLKIDEVASDLMELLG